MNFSIQVEEEKMKVYISKKTMQLNSERIVNGIAAVFFLFAICVTSISAYQVGDTFRDCETCPEMVVLPAGNFTMGSPEGERDRDDSEGPQRQVTIPKPFAVGKYEVTLGQYAEFVRETKHKTRNCGYPEDKSWENPGFKQTNNHPVVCVSWDDASTYVYWLSVKTGHEYRLLTEAEWEYAARGGTTTAYHFGRTILDNQANKDRNNKGTVAVGSFRENAFELHDMHGNVWEWVEDCWHDDYTGAPTNGSAWLSGCRKGNEDDCEGLSGDTLRTCKEHIVGKELRVLRGGSWYDGPWDLRSAVRDWHYASFVNFYFYGFRVARDLNP